MTLEGPNTTAVVAATPSVPDAAASCVLKICEEAGFGVMRRSEPFAYLASFDFASSYEAVNVARLTEIATINAMTTAPLPMGQGLRVTLRRYRAGTTVWRTSFEAGRRLRSTEVNTRPRRRQPANQAASGRYQKPQVELNATAEVHRAGCAVEHADP